VPSWETAKQQLHKSSDSDMNNLDLVVDLLATAWGYDKFILLLPGLLWHDQDRYQSV
jgi:hypothetical protein